MKQYLAIDIGGTSVKLGIVDEEGRVLAKAEQSVCFDYYETPILTTVLSASEQFLKEQDVRPQSLAGVGVSATGQIDTHTGTAACPTTSEAPSRPSWKQNSACPSPSPTTPTA